MKRSTKNDVREAKAKKPMVAKPSPQPASVATPSPVKLGQRRTRQREDIESLILNASGPLTIAEIHQGVQGVQGGAGAKDAKSLKSTKADSVKATTGIATVYRTVNLLLELQRIQSVILPNGETRYEAYMPGHHHHHFQCRSCQRVLDLDLCPVGLPKGTTIPGGYYVESHELTLFGLCPKCHKT
jgi:Fur family transcriptional regulator, ferric uptake regulator